MENINIELEEMRQQLDIFKKKLDNQNIINDAMMKQIMKGKMSWIKKYVWFQLLVLYPFIVLSWLAFKLWLDFSWWLYVYVIILTGTSVVIDIIVNNTKDSDWGNENLVDTCKKLVKMKKRRVMQEVIAIPLIAILVVWLYFELQNSTLPHEILIGMSIGGAVGAVIGLVVGFTIVFKMQRTNDEIINQIKEITSERS